jgi:hypothetical protein
MPGIFGLRSEIGETAIFEAFFGELEIWAEKSMRDLCVVPAGFSDI